MRRAVAIMALFAGLTLLFTYPLWIHPDRLLTDRGDPRLNAWILAWDAHALVHSGPVFDANIFHPADRTLAFSENLLGLGTLVAPLNWDGHPLLAYNLVLLAGLALSGALVAAWTRRLTDSWAAGAIAGIVWTFAPTRTDQLHHVQLIAVVGAPAALLALTAYLRRRRPGLLLLAAALLGWQYTSGIHASLVTFPLISMFFVLAWRERPGPRPSDSLRAAVEGALGAAIAAIPILAISLPYIAASTEQGFVRSTAEVDLYSANPASFLAAGWANRTAHMAYLYQTFGHPEANHFLGVTASVLVAVAIAGAVRRQRRMPAITANAWRPRVARLAGRIALIATGVHVAGIVVAAAGLAPTAAGQLLVRFSCRADPAVWMTVAGTLWAVLRRPRPPEGDEPAFEVPLLWCAALGYLLALGMEVRVAGVDLGNGPFRFLYYWVLPYGSMRAPGRFGLAYLLFLAPVAGAGAVALGRAAQCRTGRRAAVVLTCGVLLLALVWEYRTWPLPTVEGPAHETEVYQALASLPGDGAVLHIPVEPRGQPVRATEYMLGSIVHWRPVVNGYSGFTPAGTARLATLSAEGPAFWRLVEHSFPVRYVVVHRSLMHRPEYRRLLRRLERPRSDWRVVRALHEATIFERAPSVVALSVGGDP